MLMMMIVKIAAALARNLDVVGAGLVAEVAAGTLAAVSRHSTPASAHEGTLWPQVVSPDVYCDAR